MNDALGLRRWSSRYALILLLAAAFVMGGVFLKTSAAHAAAEELYYTPLYNDANLVSYYRFEGNASDTMGNNNGSGANVSYGTQYGKFGQGANLNGGNSVITLSTTPPAGPFTITGWIDPQNISSTMGIVEAINESNNSGFLFGLGSGGELYFCFAGLSGCAQGGNVTAGQWQFFAITYGNSTQTVYLDGTQVASYSGTMGAYSGTYNMIGDWHGYSNDTNHYFSGNMDDFAFFSRILTPTEISSLYTGDLGTYFSSLNQYYPDQTTTISEGGVVDTTTVEFGATLGTATSNTVQLQVEIKPTGFPFTGTANVASSFVSNGDGIFTPYIASNGNYHWQARAVASDGSSSSWQSFGPAGTSTVDFTINAVPNNEESMYFNGSSGLAWPVSTAALSDTGPFTIEFWYKSTSTAGTIIDDRSTSTGEGFTVSKNSSGINLTLSCNGTSSIELQAADREANDDAVGYWHQVAITKGSAISTPFSLLFDGEEQTTTDCFNSSTTSSVWLGRSALSSTNYFNGDLAEVRLWDIQRSAADITSTANEEILPTSTGLIAYWPLNGTSTELVSGNATSAQDGSPTFVSSSPMGPHYIDFQWVPSVENGKILWASSTQYSTQWNAAVNTWNAVGPISIASTSSTSTANIILDDVDSSTYPWTDIVALWYPASGTTPGGIDFNSYYLASSTSNEIQNTATHELGHALGLDHSVYGNIMYYAQTSQTILGAQDISDYNYLWGN